MERVAQTPRSSNCDSYYFPLALCVFFSCFLCASGARFKFRAACRSCRDNRNCCYRIHCYRHCGEAMPNKRSTTTTKTRFSLVLSDSYDAGINHVFLYLLFIRSFLFIHFSFCSILFLALSPFLHLSSLSLCVSFLDSSTFAL